MQNAGSVLNGSNSNISLFAPKTWFTAKDRVEELRVAPKEDVLLHSINGNSRNTKEYISNSSGSKEPKVNQTTTGAVSGESVRVVGQKLLDVADTLCENNRNVSPTELVFRKNTAKKLILLADVLNGLLSVQEFEDLMASETALQINVTKSESDDISNGKKLVLRDSSEVVENLRKELDSKLQGVEDKVELSTSTSSEDSVIADPQN